MPCLNDKNILSLNLHLCSQIKFNVCQYKIFPNTTLYFNDPKPTTSMLHSFLSLGIPSVFCQIHCSFENLWRQDAVGQFNVHIHTLSQTYATVTVCKAHNKSELSIHTVNNMYICTGDTTLNANSNTPEPDQPYHY